MKNSHANIWAWFSHLTGWGKPLVVALSKWIQALAAGDLFAISRTPPCPKTALQASPVIRVEALEERFNPASTFWGDLTPPTGGSPTTMVTADFNGDGKVDFATATNQSITLGLGKGNGQFDPVRVISTGATPKGILTGDFNGDGKVDLATANDQTDTISLLFGNGDGTFAPPVSFGVGSNPYSLASGDFNGDGKLDIATANYGSNSLSVLLGNGNGTFSQPVTLGVGSFPEGVTVGDFNGDGKADLASANNNGSTVSILLGNGNGTFKAATTANVGPAPQTIIWGDFNKDGKTDLATANYSGASVSILLGNGNGTFKPGTDLPVGQGPQVVLALDVTGDGKPDLVTANVFDNTLSLLVGNGNGTFKTATTVPAGTGPQGLGAADFSGDGKVDLVVANTTDNTILSLTGNGDGTFQTAQTLSTGGNPYAVESADFNGDGKTDLVTANATGTGLSLLLGNGNGTFLPAVILDSGSTPQGLTVGDFNKDGKKDIAFTNFGSNTVTVLLGNGNGTFKKGTDYPVLSNPFGISQGDVNGDGIVDLVSTNNGDGSISVLLGVGDGSFRSGGSLFVGSSPQGIVLGDFNRDGKLDLATVNTGGGSITVAMGNGDGTFQSGTYYTAGSSPFEIATGDFNNDGFLDLVCTNNADNSISLLTGLGDGTFNNAISLPIGSSPFGLRVGDFNLDGNQDIAAIDSVSNQVSILLGNGNGTFGPALPFGVGNNPSDLALGDFNGDGVTDLVSANNGGSNLTILLGNGDGFFRGGNSFAVGMNPASLSQGDFNGDGIPDLISINTNSSSITLLLGNGNGTFQPGQDFTVGSFPQAAAVGDFNGDGKADIAVTNNADNTLSILLGNGNGTFKTPVTLNTGASPQAVSVLDLNGDKKLDLIVTNVGDNTVSIFLGNGNGTFKTAKNASTGTIPQALTFADFNGDGKTDMGIANSGGDNLSVFLGNGDGTFKTRTDFSTGPTPYSIASGDLNGDGKQDLLTANAGSNGISVLFGNGNGTFQTARSINTGLSPFGVVIGDFNADGKLDFVTANSGANNVSLVYGNGDGTFQSPLLLTVGTNPYAVILGDWNSDGRIDLASANFMGNSISVVQSVDPKAPVITSSASGSLSVGKASTLTLAATGSPSPIFALTSGTLPSGLTLNPRTGQIQGTPAPGTSGNYSLGFRASNGIGTAATQTFTLSITEPLSITSPSSLSVDYGKSVNFQVKATGFPAPTFQISSGTLPSGITLDRITGILSGKTNSGTYNFQITASNTNGQSDSQNFQLTINKVALTITADAQTKIYGAALPGLTATISGLVNGDTNAVVTGLVLSTTATSTSNAGTYTITAAGASASNYTISYVSGTLTITQVALTITPDAKTKVYGAALPGLSATFSGFVNGEGPGVLSGLNLSTTATSSSAAGTYKITANGASSINYSISYGADANLTITKAALTITADGKSKVYGAALPNLTTTFSGLVNGDTASSISGLTVTTTATANSSTGNFPITLSGARSSNYTITLVSGTLSVTKASLTITADAKSKVYGTALPQLTATFSGLVNGDTPSTFTGLSLSTTATASSGTGSYPITLSNAASANYSIQLVNSTLTITRASLTITPDAKSKVYGSALPNLTATITGLVNGDTASVLSGLSLSSTAQASSNVGIYPIIAAGATAANYTISFLPGSLTVTTAALTITPDAKAKVYGDPLPSLTATITGLVNGDTVSSLSGLTLSTTALATSPAGIYKVTASGATNANYSITFGADANLTVTKAVVTITADSKSKVYGATLPSLTATMSGLVNGDSSSVVTGLVLSTTALASSNVGNYPITASGATAANYSFVYVNATLSVTQANLTVSADAKTKTYGDALPQLTATFSGLVNGDTPATFSGLTLSTTATASSGAGSYPITINNASSANYTIQLVNSTLTITRASLTITPDSLSKVYGSALPQFTATITGLVNGDTASVLSGLSLSSPVVASSNVGVYPITASGATAPNYTISFLPGSLTVTPAALTITPDGKTKVYGDPLPSLTATITGLVNGDTVSSLSGLTLSTTALATSPAGVYKVSATGATNANYSITFGADANLTVTKAVITITADSKSKVYGATLPSLTATMTGLVNGDSSSVVTGLVLSTTALASSNVGDYPITPSGASAANYSLVYVPATLSITRANLTVSADAKSKTYGDALPQLTATFSGLVNGDTPASLTGISFTTTGLASSPVGIYPIQVSGANSTNYNIQTVPGTLTISKALVTITPDSLTKTYGQLLPNLTATISGLVNGDNASVIQNLVLTTTALNSSSVGLYPITFIGTPKADNYDLTLGAGSVLTIQPAKLTITANNQSIIYGQVLPSLTATIAGLTNGDPESVVTGLQLSTNAQSNSKAGTYPIKAEGATTNGNYSITYVPGTLSINKANLIITVQDQTITYGDSLPNFQISVQGLTDGDTPGVITGLTFQTAAKNGSDAGDYSVQAANATALNYGIEYVPGTLTIARKSLEVRPESKTIQYGNPLPTWTLQADGLVNGDPLSVVNGVQFTSPATAQSGVGSYDISLQSARAKNYQVTLGAPGTLTIQPASLTIRANNANNIYGKNLPAFSAQYLGLVNGDSSSVVSGLILTSSATASSPVGTYAILPQGASAANYSIRYEAGSLSVTPASLTITVEPGTKTYGDSLPGWSVDYAGWVNGDGPEAVQNLVITTTATPSSPVGDYPLHISQASAANYEIHTVDNTLTIQPAPLTILPRHSVSVYGFSFPVFQADFVGLVAGNLPDVVKGLVFSTTATPSSPVGTYPVEAQGASASNYQITLGTGTLDIQPADLLITPIAKSKVYGAALPTLEATYSGFVLGENPQVIQGLILSTDAQASSPVGTYTIQASGASSANYRIHYGDPANLTVTKAALTIQAVSTSKTYGDPLPELQVQYTGLVNGDQTDVVSGLSLTTQATQASPVGIFPIQVNGGNAANYEITTKSGSLIINPASLVVKARDASTLYGQGIPAFSVDMVGLVAGDGPQVVQGLVIQTTAHANDSVGTYPISVQSNGASNYQVTYQNGALLIEKAPLTIRADDKTKPFGGAIPPLTATFTGLVNGDSPGVVQGLVLSTDAQANSPAGNYSISGSGASADNYSVRYEPGQLTIEKKLLITSPDQLGLVYGQGGSINLTTNAPATFRILKGNLPQGVSFDGEKGLISIAPTTVAGTYPITIQASSGPGGAETTQDFTLTIAKAQLLITATNQEKRYGESVPGLGVTISGLLNGDDATVVSGLTLTTTATSFSPVGIYPVQLSGGMASNYDLTLVSGQLKVTKANLTIKADDQTKTYGDPVGTLTASYSGLVAGDTPSSIRGPTITTAANAKSSVGTYLIGISGGSSPNYEITLAPGSLTILKADLLIRPDNKTQLQGAAFSPWTATYEGLVAGDPASVVKGLVLTSGANSASPVGTYPITASQATAANYSIRYATGTLTLVAPATFTGAKALSWTYGQSTSLMLKTSGYPGPSFRLMKGTLPPGLTLNTTTGELSTNGKIPAGTYVFTLGASNGVGTESTQDFTLTIAKATLKITPQTVARTYGSANPALSAQYTGLVNGDLPSVVKGLTLTTTATPKSLVGNYPITASGATASNYLIQFVPGTLSVTPANLTIGAQDATKVYGSALPAFKAKITGLVAGDTEAVIKGLKLTSSATAASSVGSYAILPSGATAANYYMVYQPGTLTISRATLTIQPVSATKVYGAPLPNFTPTIQGLVNGDTASKVTGLEWSTTATAGSNVGSYSITGKNAVAPNYDIQYTPGTLTITRATLTIHPEPKTKTYGASLPAFTASYQGLVNGDTSSVVSGLVFTTTATKTSKVGPYAITASKAVASNYTIVFTPGQLTVTPTALVIQANAQVRTYGQANAPFGYTVQGLVNGETQAVLSGLILSTTAKPSSPVGTYLITPAGAKAANYTITFRTAALTVQPAVLTITPVNATKMYGADLPVLNSTITGLVNGETTRVISGLNLQTTATRSSAVGSYPITAEGATANNYTIQYGTGTLTITKANLIVRAQDSSRPYGAKDPALGAVYTGLVNGDASTVIRGLKLSSTALGTSPIGTYSITPSGAVADNYTIQYQPGKLTVQKADLRILGQSVAIPVGAKIPDLAVTYQGLVNNETPKVVSGLKITTTAKANSPVGSYPILLSGAIASNYNVSLINGRLSIGNAPVITSPNGASFTYGKGGAFPVTAVGGSVSFQYSLKESIAGISLDSQSGQLLVSPKLDSGTYSLTLGVSSPFGSSTQIFTLTISKAKLTLTADPQTAVYGSDLPSWTYQIRGLVNGDTPGVVSGVKLNSSAQVGSGVGQYPITIGEASARNYEITYVPGSLTITPAMLTITPQNQVITYGDAFPQFTSQINGLVGSDNASVVSVLTWQTTANTYSDAGSYAITATTPSAANYQIRVIPGTLTINPAKLIITARSQEKVYGAALPVLTARYEGLATWDTPLSIQGLTLSTDATTTSSVGTYGIQVSGAFSPNYTITQVPGILSVTPASLTITPVAATKVYGSQLPVLQTRFAGLVGGDTADVVQGLTLKVEATASSPVGTYTITASGALAANYQISYGSPSVLTVTPAPLIIGVKDITKTYGDAMPPLETTILGLVNQDTSDVVTGLSLSTPGLATSPVGDYPILASGAQAANYQISYQSGTLHVTRAHLSIVADPQTRPFGQDNPILTASITGLVNGDTSDAIVGLALTTLATNQSGVGTYAIHLSGAYSPNYDIDLIDSALTITRAQLTLTVQNQTKVYGSQLPQLTVQYQGLAPWDDSSVVRGLQLFTSATASSKVGTYPILAQGATADNYDLTFVPGQLTITPASLIITPLAASKVYGSDLPVLQASFDGLVGGDTLDRIQGLILHVVATASSPVGTYTITASGAMADNYQITYGSPSFLTVTQAPLVIGVIDTSKTYGDPLPALESTIQGLVNGDSADVVTGLSLSTSALASSPVGDYPVLASGAQATNYQITYQTGTLHINRAHLSIVVDPQTRVFGQDNPRLTARFSGLVNGDTPDSIVGWTLTTEATNQSGVGTYPIHFSGANSPNYDIDMVDSTLTITKARLTLTVQNQTKTYGAALPQLTVQYQGLAPWDDSSVVNGLQLVTPATASSKVGTYSIMAQGATAENYDLTLVPGQLTITRAILKITPDAKMKLVNGPIPRLTATFQGLVNGDTQAVVRELYLQTPVLPTTRPGVYSITASNAKADNYEIQFGSSTMTVGKAPVFTSSAGLVAQSGQVTRIPVQVTGFPPPVLRIVGDPLPAGISFDPATATMIIQANLVSGIYSFVLGASNGFGAEVTQGFTLTVK